MKLPRDFFTGFWALVLLPFLAACGVKGPPLPPIPTTPQDSEPYPPRPTASPNPLKS